MQTDRSARAGGPSALMQTEDSPTCHARPRSNAVRLTFRSPMGVTVPARWSMRPWESPPIGAAAQGLPGSHGPSKEELTAKRVNLRSRSRCAGFLPEVAAALAFGPLTAALKRTALALIRASIPTPVAAPVWTAGSGPAMTTESCGCVCALSSRRERLNRGGRIPSPPRSGRRRPGARTAPAPARRVGVAGRCGRRSRRGRLCPPAA
jgi:hypothetical protein